MLLKNSYIRSLNLLNFIRIVVFDVETAPKNAKSVLLERLQWQIVFASSQSWGRGRLGNFPQQNFLVFKKTHCEYKFGLASALYWD